MFVGWAGLLESLCLMCISSRRHIIGFCLWSNVRWFLGEFNPLTVIVLTICLICFWHLALCIFLMFPLFFFCCCHMTLSSLIKYTYKLVWRVYILFLFHFWLTYGLSYSWVHSHSWHDNWSFHCSCCFPRLYIHVPAYSKLCSWSWISHFVYDLIWNNLFAWKWNIFVTLCRLLFIC